MNEIKIKKNIKKILTSKGKGAMFFPENQGRQPPLRWVNNKKWRQKNEEVHIDAWTKR